MSGRVEKSPTTTSGHRDSLWNWTNTEPDSSLYPCSKEWDVKGDLFNVNLEVECQNVDDFSIAVVFKVLGIWGLEFTKIFKAPFFENQMQLYINSVP